MFRSTCAWVSAAALVTSSFAQPTPQQVQRNAEIERRQILRSIEMDKVGLGKAQAVADQDGIAEYAFRIAFAYEQPNSFDHQPLDLTEARKWYANSASHGNSARARAAAYRLGLMHWDGRGGPEDKDRAKYIWMWAAQNGDAESILQLRKLKYDLETERERALGVAESGRDQAAAQQRKAEEGLAIVFGLWFAASLAKNFTCQQERQQQLMQGGAASGDCR